MKFLEFFKDSNGHLSSKRFIMISAGCAAIINLPWLENKLITIGRPELAVEVFISFLAFCAITGGFVSLEVIKGVLGVWKGGAAFKPAADIEKPIAPKPKQMDS